MALRLANKVAIITGGANGIGRAAVRRFAEEGACVVVADIDENGGAASAADAGPPQQVIYQRFDAGDEASWRELIAITLRTFGSLQIIVNNAAARTPLTLEQTTLEAWRANHRVTSDGAFLGTKLGGEAITGPGAIVNVASIAAFVGLPASFPYSAAKGALRAMSRSAALHFAATDRNIRVNVVAPGATLTEAIRRQAVLLAERQGVTPDTVLANLAEAILFLASDEASFITGAELLVDGGMTAA
jgi:NAD(P)-dependent dehydrogenase (short-subunit alcohol dehydrogenase family)